MQIRGIQLTFEVCETIKTKNFYNYLKSVGIGFFGLLVTGFGVLSIIPGIFSGGGNLNTPFGIRMIVKDGEGNNIKFKDNHAPVIYKLHFREKKY